MEAAKRAEWHFILRVKPDGFGVTFFLWRMSWFWLSTQPIINATRSKWKKQTNTHHRYLCGY